MNRVWMITGAGRGLGRAFAEEAVKNGDQVIATVRKLNEDDELVKKENVLPVIMDVTNKDAVKKAVQTGLRKFGRIDVLINNAGFGASGAFEEISDEELRILIGKKCCEDVRGFLGDRISEIVSYIEESSQTDY